MRLIGCRRSLRAVGPGGPLGAVGAHRVLGARDDIVGAAQRALRRVVRVVGHVAQTIVVSVTQQIDLTGPVGRMVASVMFGLAEIELEYRRERQAAGIRVARNRGIYQGRISGTTKALPKRAIELRDRGLKIPEIANALNVSERSVFRYLGQFDEAS